MTVTPRYGNQDLFLLKSFHREFKDSLVDQSEYAPFPRQIDLWWYMLGIGVNAEQQRVSLPGREHLVKFNDGGILEADPWRIAHLELLVLTEEGQSAASNPVRVVQIANEYAMTGCEMLVGGLRDTTEHQHYLIAYAIEREPA